MQFHAVSLALLGVSIISISIGFYSTISTITMIECSQKEYRCRLGLTGYGLGVFLGGAYTPKLLHNAQLHYGDLSPALILTALSLGFTIIAMILNKYDIKSLVNTNEQITT